MLVPERFRVSHAGMRRAYAGDPRPRAMGGGRELFARRKGRRRSPGGGGVEPGADRGWIARAGVGGRRHRAQAHRAGIGPPARRARPPVARRNAGRAVRIARARAQPAADGDPEQCAGGAAVSRAEPAAHRQARGNPHRHREERSSRRSGDSAAAVPAQEGRGAASSGRRQRPGRGIAAPDAQRPAEPAGGGQRRPCRRVGHRERRPESAAAGVAQLRDQRMRRDGRHAKRIAGCSCVRNRPPAATSRSRSPTVVQEYRRRTWNASSSRS